MVPYPLLTIAWLRLREQRASFLSCLAEDTDDHSVRHYAAAALELGI